MSEPIGKLMYIGKSSKGDLINGKTYDCLDLSFGDVQVIDESGEPYWYSATNPSGGGGKDHSVWAVIEDNSNKKLLTEFVSGKNDRTEKDKAEEEGKILASLSIETGKGSRMMKHKKIVRRYVEETPELKEAREKQFETIAKILVGSFCDNMCKYGSFENYKKSFDSQLGDEYEYIQACALVAEGKYYSAKRAFEQSGYGDWEERAEELLGVIVCVPFIRQPDW